MSRLLLVLALAVAPAGAMSATIYKCVGADGKTVFSDKQCGSQAEAIEYSHPETWKERISRERAESSARLDELRQQEIVQRREQDARISKMKEQHRALCESRIANEGLAIGMTKSQLYDSEIWGYPDDISKTTTANAVKEYFVYKCDGYKSVRLFVTNGRLSSIHN
ncbi:DUF4124 domain-containing protein [Stutzerimonas nitrititolerans]|uniref:DUF4124 domain-containing protein n=1 Tax=Stutzerimonas nitrititolerans TaxID=2482751 RepID=A0ABX9USU9_9GAMM|nr:DUF4124 domain-containing protein [Stutzerimonas nitrititolerans]RMH96364.1 DUF4124 domain-containing protein [Stutzerimonas nitrititolerans]